MRASLFTVRRGRASWGAPTPRPVVRPTPTRRPLTAADLDSFMKAELDPQGPATVTELLEICQRLRKVEPIRARSAEHTIRWILKAANKHLGDSWRT